MDDARESVIRACVGEREVMNDPLKTFGGYGVVRIRDVRKLLRYICESGFERNLAINPVSIALGVREALARYMGWEVDHHE
jgi:hypothetical protein